MTLEETIVDNDFIELMNEYRKAPKDTGLLEACSESVVLFAEKMLGFRLYAWQVAFLIKCQNSMIGNYWTKEFVALTSRQIGKSTAIAILSLWACVFNKYKGTVHSHTAIGIVSASDVQAKKLLYEVKKFIRIGDIHMKTTYKEADEKPMFGSKFFSDLLSTDDPNNTTTITFCGWSKKHGEFLLKDSKSGSLIKSYPPTAAVLGETFTVVIEDEAGKTDKITDQFHYDFAYPTGNSTNAIRVYTSTPWTPSGFFYRLSDPNDDFTDHPAERFLFTIEAIKLENPEYYQTVMKIVNQMNADGKTDEVQRAYYCRFVKGEANYFDPEKVMDVFESDMTMINSYEGECDMGVDFGGQVKSKTVITISRLTGDGIIERLFHKSYEVGQDLSLLDDIAALKVHFNVQRIIPDDCPAGDFLIRTMKEKGWNLTPMNFRTDKVKKYGAFRSSMNRREVKSYIDDELKTEMLALENSQSSRSSVIVAPPGYNDDRIDSFVLSAYHYVQEEGGFKFYDYGD